MLTDVSSAFSSRRTVGHLFSWVTISLFGISSSSFLIIRHTIRCYRLTHDVKYALASPRCFAAKTLYACLTYVLISPPIQTSITGLSLLKCLPKRLNINKNNHSSAVDVTSLNVVSACVSVLCSEEGVWVASAAGTCGLSQRGAAN
jgi:hypothetical protein